MQSYIGEGKERRKRKTESVFLNPIYAVVDLGVGAVDLKTSMPLMGSQLRATPSIISLSNVKWGQA